jgi:SAM-dependent methyltransferase
MPERRAPKPCEGAPAANQMSPGEHGAETLSPAFLELLEAEPLGELTVLDVGTGAGRLALALASRARAVVGVDREARLIDEARKSAAAAGLTNLRFVVGDVEVEEYAPFRPDMVVAHLCVSDAIAERAGRVLKQGGVFAFVALHTDQWKETGRPSRFAWSEVGAKRLLKRCGFAVETLAVEREVAEFETVEQGLAAAVALQEKWKQDGRWFRYVKFLEEGGRTLTRARLVVKARKA